ncbi:hypothetical protein DOTSEDRAFT_54681 [Dothistroma septosporum NZE10]|uniref:F-box domain-containing protein n=1 Tax=Dothistroma septosporum (strain NZE10 / CBS 128990) TaxID=675120 RepID=N1PL45_DOTSN|nr:hypothetical protein DOTSEDRAFT_54681 [Dothistroma septosporum NZE10]
MGNVSSRGEHPFSFLHLPPELRNEVYRHSLTHDRRKGHKATPALLRTCKQIYDEGISILNAESTLSVTVSVRPWSSEITLTGDFHRERQSESIAHTLPLRLTNIRNLQLHLKHAPLYGRGAYTNAGSASAIHDFLTQLTASLRQSTLPRTITCALEIEPPNCSAPGPSRIQDPRVEEMLTPLFPWPATASVRVESRAPSILGVLGWLASGNGWLARSAARSITTCTLEAEQV